MDELRLKRYTEKINYIIESIPFISTRFTKEIERRGIYYSIQTSIESLVDLIAMLVKDYGLVVKDDKENIRLLVEHKNLSSEIGERLIKANGLRNILVHRYNGIDDSIILDSIKEITDITEIWLNKIEELINELRSIE
ncbi:DUF86 domain-containing protein [Promethearchaeum syntrophicum]|uniref:DUF86 domain-containing protein n=1 Tax=Promethearchaeum syntrophicum TaxID=2594042 RepID=A0A5B9DFN5_9ARCH|nr:DUF86 domain-containing protein [Candidatus Prometheoarchaeum syntrophicum]QEE17603.1 hypothetical protein DSAG12_03440 [Candidatus Prometheoarchaeum syntrophicum]